MIRVALGGLLALAALAYVWQHLLKEAVPEAIAPVARVTTLDLEELREPMRDAEVLADDAVRVVEERLTAALDFEPEPPSAPGPDVAIAFEPPASDPDASEGAVDAALIRRMLDVYARTASPE